MRFASLDEMKRLYARQAGRHFHSLMSALIVVEQCSLRPDRMDEHEPAD